MSDYLSPRRLTPATDAYDQEQSAMAAVNQRAAGQDIVGQQVAAQKAYAQQNRDAQANAARIQREQEAAQRKQETQQKQAVTNAKKVGIKTEIDPTTANERVVTHANGSPMYEHGFQGDPEVDTESGNHVVKFRTPHGQIYKVPTNAIRSSQDEAGASQYEFDLPQEDGSKKTVRQPVGSNPLFSIDPKTGMRYTGAADPETGSVGTTPIGYDPAARSKAVLEQKKLEFTQQQDASKFQADELHLAQNAQETNLAPIKKQLTEAQAIAKKLDKEKTKYRSDPEKGLVKVVDFGNGPTDIPIPSTDPAAVSAAQSWIDKKAAADKALAEAKAAHDPLAAEVQTMQQKRDQLAIEALNHSRSAQVQMMQMEKAQKAGLPVHEPDWQKRIAAARTDPRVTSIFSQAELDQMGGPLAEDAKRVSLPETTKLFNRVMASMQNGPATAPPGSGVLAPGQQMQPVPMQRPQGPSLEEMINSGLAVDNVPVKGADVKALTAQALGITEPEKWQVNPSEGISGDLGYHTLTHNGEDIGEFSTRENRFVLNPPSSDDMDRQQQRLINTSSDGLPVYFASNTPPLPKAAVSDIIRQGVDISQSSTDRVAVESKLAEAKLSPADLRQKVMSGELSVQDGRLLNETFHGITDVDASKPAIEAAFGQHLASPVLGPLFKKGDLTTRQGIVNQFMDAYAERAGSNIIAPSRSDLAKYRDELLAKTDPRGMIGKGVDFVTDLPRNAIAPMAGMAVQLLTSPYYLARKGLGYKDAEADIIWNGGRDLIQRLANDSNPVHRMFGDGEMKQLLQEDLRAASDKIQSVDELPDDLAHKIRDAAFDGYHRFTDENAKDVNTTRDSYDIKKDPTLRAMFDRYLQTADGSTFDSMLQMLSMTANDRATQKQTMEYLERPRTATADNVIDRAKLLDMNLDAGRAAQVLAIGKQLDSVKDEKQYKNVITQAGKVLGLEKPADIQLALSHLTHEETDKPDSWRSSFNSGRVANPGEILTEVGSDLLGAALTASIIGAPEAVALKAAQVGARQALKRAFMAPVTALRSGVSKIAKASMDSLAEKSARFAAARTMLQKVPAKYQALGIVEPKFGSSLTTLQKTRNLGVGLAKSAVAIAPIEATEEGLMAGLDAAPTPGNLVDSMVQGALGGTVLVPMFAGAQTLSRAWGAQKRNQSITDYKTGLVDKFNERMAGQAGFTPLTVADFDIMQGIQDNPAHQSALQDHAAALEELGAATQEHTQNVMDYQDAAAGNAVPSIPESPRLLTAQANAQRTAANIEGLSSMAFSATDELRALPDDERPLYTGIAKAVSGATDYTEAEGKALIGLGGQSAVAFQQALALPADVSGPANVTQLPGAPTVTPTGLGSYRLPAGVRIQVPPQAIAALQERAPSLSGLIGGQMPSPKRAAATPAATTQNIPQQNAGQQTAAPLPRNPALASVSDETLAQRHALAVELSNRPGQADAATYAQDAAVMAKEIEARKTANPASFVPESAGGLGKPLPQDAIYDDETAVAENEVRSVIDAVVAKEIHARNHRAGRALIVTQSYKANDGGALFHIESNKVVVDPERLASEIWNNKSAAPTRYEVARAAELVIDHEVVHAAQIQAARDTYDKLNPTAKAKDNHKAFMAWVADYYGKMWREDFPEHIKTAVIQTYGAILEGKSDWHKSFEALRMIVQDRLAGKPSEAATFLSIREHLEAVLAVLKKWYEGVMKGGEKHIAIKAEIEAIEALLANNSQTNTPATTNNTSTNENQTGSEKGNGQGRQEQEVLLTGSAASPTNTGGEAASLNFNVPLTKRGQVRQSVFPDAESLAAFQFKLDLDTAASAKSTPEESAAAKQRGIALLAKMMEDSPLTRPELEKKLLEYHADVVTQAEGTSALDTFTPPAFHTYAKTDELASKSLPPPAGGDIISGMQAQGIRRLGPPENTDGWSWYRELEADASQSKLKPGEAQRLARAGDLTDARARLAWINENVVSRTSGRSIDEAAAELNDSADQQFPLESGDQLGRAIMEALDARAKAKQGGVTPEAEQEQQTKDAAASFDTLKKGAEGQPFTASQLSRSLENGDEIKIGGEIFTVSEVDPIDEYVRMESDRFGPVEITGEETVNLSEGANGKPVDSLASAPSQAITETGNGISAPPAMSQSEAARTISKEQAESIIKESSLAGRPIRTYEQAVAANQIHMGTRIPEWTAFPFTGDTESGRPTQDLAGAEGMQKAPTLFPNGNAADHGNCEWCGKQPVKNFYHIKNDGKSWTMTVGSECISHFANISGEAMASNAREQKAIATIESLEDARKEMRKEFLERVSIGYGRTDTIWKSAEAQNLNRAMSDLQGKTDAKSGKAALSRWIGKNLQEAQKLTADFSDLMARPDTLQRKIRWRKMSLIGIKSDLKNKASTSPEWQVDQWKKTEDKLQKELEELQNTEALASAPSRYQSPASMLAATQAQMQGMNKPAETQPKTPAIAPSSIIDAYRSATIGQSSAMIPISSVFDKAKESQPNLTVEDFLAALDSMDDGRALFGLTETTAAYNAAKPFVHGPAGVEMAFSPELVKASTILSNLDRVKAVRKLQPNEQAAYDKAEQMLQPSESLASAPSRVTPKQDAAYLQAVESGDVAKQQAMVDAARLLPRQSFYKGDIEIIRNPSDADYRELNASYKKEYPFDRSGDPTTRFTTDANGNRWIWRSDLGIHNQMEPFISNREGRHVSQNESNWNPDASEPVVKDRAGNVVPLSQRFNANSDSILYSAPTESAPSQATPDNSAQVREIIESMPQVWQNVLNDFNGGKSIADIAKDRLYTPEQTTHILTQAQGRFDYLRGQLPTKPRVAPVPGGEPLFKGGRPDLALSGIPAVAAVIQNRGTPEQVTHAEMQEAATRMFAVDEAATEKLVTRWMDGGGMAFSVDDMPDGIKAIVADAQSKKASLALMTAAAQILTVENAFAGGNSAKSARLIDLFLNSGEEIARGLSQRRDPFESRAERNAWYLQNVLLVPPPSIRAEMKKNPANKDKILERWAAKADKIKAEMLADGIDLDATFKQMAKEKELAAATIPEAIRQPLAVAPKSTRQAVKAIMEGGTWQDALNASGLDLKAAQKAYNAFRGSLRGLASRAVEAIRNTLGSAPGEDYHGMPEWTNDVNLQAAPVRNKATQALAIQRNRKMAQGELDLRNPLSANKGRRAIESRKASGFDKLSEFWRASILSGPQTGIVNVVSGVTYGTYEATVKKMSAALLADIARMFGMKPDAPSLRDLPSMFAAIMPSLRDAGRDMVKAWNTETPVFDSYALNRTDETGDLWKEGHTSALKGWTKKIMHAISFRHMGAADEMVKSFFTRIEVAAQARQIARTEGLSGHAMANRMSELMVPGSLAWERSLAQAKRITFQNQEVGNVKLESTLQPGHAAIDSIDHIAEFIQKAKTGDYGKLLKGLFHVLFPFVATPANILKMGITMSPLGSGLAIIDAVRALQRHRSGNVEEAKKIYNAARALDDFTNQVIAWGTMLAIYSLIKPGDDGEPPFFTGTEGLSEASPGERELAYRTAPPQSIRIGKKWYSYRRLDPFASWLAPTIDSMREFQLGKPLDQVIPKVIGNVMKALKEKSYMQGISDFVNAANSPDRHGLRWASNIAIGLVPNAIRQTLRATDPNIRDTDQPNDMSLAEGIGRRLGYGMYPHPNGPLTPLPAVSVFGRPINKDTGTGQPGTDFMLRLFSPVEAHTMENVDPLELKLLQWNMNNDDIFGITAPSRELKRTIGGKEIKVSLDDAEDQEYTTRSGKAFRAALESFAQKNGPLSADDIEEIKSIHTKVMRPFSDAAFGTALQKRIADGKIKL